MIRSVPIYDYRCDACGHAFSLVRSYSDGPVEVCPNCGKRPRKLLVAPAVVFKGSGWYKTDSRGAAPKESGDGGTSPEKSSEKASSSGTKSGGASEPKSESKSELRSDSESESQSESKSGTKGESKSESKPASDPSPKSETKS
jgi:putative FmdB family regulatory protein